MALHAAPFSSPLLGFLSGLSWALVFPCYWLLDRLLASFLSTSQEKRRRSQDPCSFLALCVLVSTPLYLLLILAALPLALLGFLLWAPLQAARRPLRLQPPAGRRPARRAGRRRRRRAGGGGAQGEWRPQGRSFCFCSANVCLLPDSLARFNNLSDTQGRAREVGRRIRNGASRPQIKIYIDSPTNTSISAASFSSLRSPSPPPAGGVQISISARSRNPRRTRLGPARRRARGRRGSLDSRTASRESLARFHGCDGGGVSNNTLSHRTSVFKKPALRRRRHGDDGFDHEISAFFPANLDFLCLQEVFDRRAAARLRRQLHRYFPFVLSDVGRYAWKGCCSRFKFLNSGLLLASRYPILDADYQCYPNARGHDALVSKGALFAKGALSRPRGACECDRPRKRPPAGHRRGLARAADAVRVPARVLTARAD
ncbi:hypothetical protein ANANG_G00208690 [Anguilla anguilla]|uniref:sphingomyelin phosphodiesterase n=1 Tax=Anguilla anguilla TaxID=7936 RepID=A0A9D3RR20_ANGAN|nr:hypothetical protein ANANG_G00208690 [Anguilla anguilla]